MKVIHSGLPDETNRDFFADVAWQGFFDRLQAYFAAKVAADPVLIGGASSRRVGAAVEIAIVGTGKVAERNYIPSLLRHDDVSLTLHSRTRGRADAWAEQYGVPVAGSLDELFARRRAVFVLTGEQERLEATRSLGVSGPSGCSWKNRWWPGKVRPTSRNRTSGTARRSRGGLRRRVRDGDGVQLRVTPNGA